MGSGDPSGLQNRRELALLALVSSTLTRFRHSACNGFGLDYSVLSRPKKGSLDESGNHGQKSGHALYLV